MKTYKDRNFVLRTKIRTALKPAGKDLECIIGIDDPMESGSEATHIYLTNHRTGSSFGLLMSLTDDDRFIVRTVVGAAKTAWPHLTNGIRWEDFE